MVIDPLDGTGILLFVLWMEQMLVGALGACCFPGQGSAVELLLSIFISS